ncbi:MAG: hypothetical protein JSR77_03925 [Planctomycetes bacterium]|nr:hypothetical protein [Planctomycetota bacterium]
MFNKATNVLVVGFLAATSALLVGCDGTPKVKPMDIGVAPDASLKDAGSGKMGKVEVDLVAVGKDDEGKWDSKSINDYFSGNDALRAGATAYSKSFVFADGQDAKIVVAKGDPIWNVWKQNRPILFIMANSRALAMESAKQEVRRKKINLLSDRWPKVDAFTITVKNGGIEVNPPPTEPVK